MSPLPTLMIARPAWDPYIGVGGAGMGGEGLAPTLVDGMFRPGRFVTCAVLTLAVAVPAPTLLHKLLQLAVIVMYDDRNKSHDLTPSI